MIGTRLAHYQITAHLGSGGFGDVYQATDSKLGRNVAIKLLPEEFARDADRIARFDREACVLASLNHPHIAAIYGVEDSEGRKFLVMEFVGGETLADRIKRGSVPVEETLAIAKQICEAVEAAHEKGIIHRDLKPANIKVTLDGKAKVLDFGLAKQFDDVEATVGAALTELTVAGAAVGTIAYMSPEQMRGLPVDFRTDLFSLGVVLYEMLTGERPFTGSTAIAVTDAIMHGEPRSFGDRPVPVQLKSLIVKLLEKDPADRHENAEAVHRELQALEAALSPARPARVSRNAWIAVGTAVVLASVVVGWLWRGAAREQWALATATPEIVRLVDAGEYVKAAALTRQARTILPNNPALEKLWAQVTGEVAITSVPADAEVSFRVYPGDPNVWETLGKTPIAKVRVPRGVYVWRVAKAGFDPAFFFGQPLGPQQPGFGGSLARTLTLSPVGSAPPDMLAVSAGQTGIEYPTQQAPSVMVDAFLIDQHEVTNEQYKKFVDSGGYQKREFWKQPFVRNGKTISWEEGVALFLDSTGRPGPATWEVGSYRKGMDQHPVAGVSWYEAAAYAEFAGKSLPTAYHWTRASQAVSYTPVITPGSNFRSEGTQPVGSISALSGSGTTDMAGNVKEWCLNEGHGGNRFILGGGFGEPAYMFNHTDVQSPWDRQSNFGFRCVRLGSPVSPAAAATIAVTTRDYSKDKPVSNDVFKAYTAMYAYDKGELNSRVEETVTTERWTREKVTFDAAYGRERVIAQLFLPRNATPPFQTIVYFPGAGALSEDKFDMSIAETSDTWDFLLKSGRALIFPIYKGTYERRDGLKADGKPPAAFRDHVILWSKDLSRSIDYLETRKDIDASKLAYFGASWGGVEASIMAVADSRIKTMILSSGGLQLRYDLPEVDPFNFAPHVSIPVLMITGRYDNTFPLESSQLPLFRSLGTPARDKKQVIYEGGHGVFPRPDAFRESLDWLDKYLGSVRH